MNVYTLSSVSKTMQKNAKEYLSKQVGIIGFEDYASKKVLLVPKLMDWYRKDFGETGSDKDLIAFLTPYLSVEIVERLNFFKGSVKINFKDTKWSMFEGFPASENFNPEQSLEESRRIQIEKTPSKIFV
eukprot:TRINITY_DN6014_c0_g1_i2.p1 TRINITY_DN6014_c0_g1~~TRINITY_DN6014_c0_g1_i2.p1  ORF type:complete len:129 (+),score=30.27 TRINITY_DN6014_c0_g1_i2:169-555(+)